MAAKRDAKGGIAPRMRNDRGEREPSATRRRARQPPAAGRQPLGSPGSGGAAFGAGGYGAYCGGSDYAYGAVGEYGESQTGLDLPYGQEQSGRGGYTGY